MALDSAMPFCIPRCAISLTSARQSRSHVHLGVSTLHVSVSCALMMLSRLSLTSHCSQRLPRRLDCCRRCRCRRIPYGFDMYIPLCPTSTYRCYMNTLCLFNMPNFPDPQAILMRKKKRGSRPVPTSCTSSRSCALVRWLVLHRMGSDGLRHDCRFLSSSERGRARTSAW
ncbi:hypothetical protein EXIGLDRAFT_309465 [Exidia glandulosa HHB12029]|uniref:Uncharacterized protein n=1 Tax=Exidia glandulosa HHB12029 TaxID=1314781 RepID=A0A165D0N4_EXIGL|nr:hypothetical protein EXIGLDRAFT_309465 [Exidia glandulosa HHB12029]